MNEKSKLTIDSIQTATFYLLENNSFDSLTISSICKKAGVSRMAFYRHFKTKDDVITNFTNTIYSKIMYYLETKIPHQKQLGIEYFFNYHKFYKKELTLLIDRNLINLLFNSMTTYITKFFMKKISNSHNLNYIASYSAGGLYSMLITWVKNDMKQSSKELNVFIQNIQLDN